MDEHHRLLRSVEGIGLLRSWFRLGVSFFESLVNRHRIEIFLLDGRGRIAGSFQRFHWSESEVVDQAAALLAEPEAPPRAATPKVLPLLGGPVGAVLAAVIPKCPVCWAAYLSAFGLTGFAGSASHRGLQLLAAGLLAVNLASVLWRARSTRQWLGVVLSAAGTAAILLKLWLGLPNAQLGIGLVILGSLFSALGQRFWEWLSLVGRGTLTIGRPR
jgi:protein SCO1/2